MEPTFKLRQASDLFCDLDGVTSPESRNRRYSQMRLLSQNGVILPINEDISRGKVAYYSLEEVAKARILFRLYEVMSDTRALRELEFNFALRGLDIGMRPRPDWNNGEELRRHIKAVIEGVSKGERWVFDVTLKVDHTGQLFGSSYFHREGKPRVRDLHSKKLAEYDANQGHRVLAYIDLSATDLLKPLLDKIEG